MATETRNFGTFSEKPVIKRRDDLTLIEARNEVKLDREDGIRSEVVMLIPPHKFIDDTFVDDVVLMHSDLQAANAKLAAVRAVIELHAKGYESSSDETFDNNGVCTECDLSYPCDTRTALEEALR